MAYAARMAQPCSKVEIRIECQSLQNKDLTSKSDPCCVMLMNDKGRWYEYGRTENIKNDLNPKFTKTFEIDYYFEEVQKLLFQVYDIDNKTPDLNDDDFLGQMECTLGQVVSSGARPRPLYKKDGTHAGKGLVTVTAEEVSGVNDIFHLSFKAEKLDKKDFLGKSDPYLEFSRASPSGQWQVVHRTEVIKNTLNPVWRTVEVKAQKLCAGDFNRVIKVAVYDFDDNNDNDLIGEFETSVAQLQETIDRQLSWPVINPKKKAKKSSYKDSGTVFLTSCKVTKEYSFLDFVTGGLQINFTVCVDFTASNGDPRTPQSLHFLNPTQPNEYMKAIRSVGDVVQDYDADKMFPALGFGARIPPNYDAVSHEFALNFNAQNPFCAGVDGILQAYTACISQVQLYGPTNFSPMINHVAKFGVQAQQEGGAKNYFVLLILTDGVITDLDNTRHAIVAASALPMSIIIVGVGSADFTAMNILDGDDGLLRSPTGQPVKRDIVQFVPFREFVNAPQAELAKHVLAEVPKQVCDYFKMMGIAPSPRPPPGGAPYMPPGGTTAPS